MEAKSASLTAATPGAGEPVAEAATPIDLLAASAQIARDALASQASQQASHASNSTTEPQPRPETLETPRPTQESVTTTVTPPSGAVTQDVAASGRPRTITPPAVQQLTPPSSSLPPLEVIKESQPFELEKKAVKTPVNEINAPEYLTASPAVGLASPHPNVGNKRTASGAIKAPSTSLPATPYQQQAGPASSPRNGRERIGELSTQLRSRLSYAMIKMQNGLQGQTFDQVEHFIAEKQYSRLSQSPATTSNTPLMPSAPIASGFTAVNPTLKREPSRESAQGGLGITLMPSVPASPRAPASRVGRHSRTTSDPSTMFLNPAANIISQNDANFWAKPPPSPRSSNIRGIPQGSPGPPADSFAARMQMSPNRHLAPAAPIRHHSRSSSGPAHHTLPARRGRLPPPSLPKTFSNMSTMSNVSNISTAPTDVLSLLDEPISQGLGASSSIRPHTPVRTNTLTMEQDAVESLMFLSSPGNSQPRGSRPTSRSAVSTHQPQFQSQLIQQIWNGSRTDTEGDSFMGEMNASTVVDDDEVRLVEEDDELDRELDREKNEEYDEDTDQELRNQVNGTAPMAQKTIYIGRGGPMNQSGRVKRVKTMEEVMSAAERADAASHWQYAAAGTEQQQSKSTVAPSPLLSG